MSDGVRLAVGPIPRDCISQTDGAIEVNVLACIPFDCDSSGRSLAARRCRCGSGSGSNECGCGDRGTCIRDTVNRIPGAVP